MSMPSATNTYLRSMPMENTRVTAVQGKQIRMLKRYFLISMDTAGYISPIYGNRILRFKLMFSSTIFKLLFSGHSRTARCWWTTCDATLRRSRTSACSVARSFQSQASWRNTRGDTLSQGTSRAPTAAKSFSPPPSCRYRKSTYIISILPTFYAFSS